jgi:hypothetical protein
MEYELGRDDRTGVEIVTGSAIITRAGRDEDVVLIGFAVEGIEIAVEAGGVDVFVRIAEGEIVENVVDFRGIGADLCSRRLGRRAQEQTDCRSSHGHLGGTGHELATRFGFDFRCLNLVVFGHGITPLRCLRLPYEGALPRVMQV